MQGKLPCHACPYGERCEECPELKVRAEGQKPENYEKGGFYSQEVRAVKSKDGKITYSYSHPE